MLSRINIRNYVIVDQLEVELADGMTVLTGETGAGKSILVDALCLALGDRSDASTVRAGSDKAEIAVEFEISTMPLVQDWLRNNDLNEDEDSVQLRRIITAEGRSRGYINGRKVTMQQLRVLGENLVDIHGQHEHQSLMRKNHQRVLLDAYGQAQDLVAATASAHTIWRDLSQRAETLSQSIQERDERLDFLRFQVQELEVLELDQDSVDRLEAEYKFSLMQMNWPTNTSSQAISLPKTMSNPSSIC